MEIPFCTLLSYMKDCKQEKDVSDTPPEICEKLRHVGIVMHDKRVYCPVVITEKAGEKEDDKVQISPPRNLDIFEKAAQKSYDRDKQSKYVFKIIITLSAYRNYAYCLKKKTPLLKILFVARYY